MPFYIDIVLPLPVPQAFTYRCPDTLSSLVVPGARVLVPFHNKKMTGYVIGLSASPPKDVRDILDVLDDEPALDAHLLELTRWISQYYLCSWGEAIRNALPASLSIESKRILVYAQKHGESLFDDTLDLTNPRARLLKILKERQRLSVEALKQRAGRMANFNAHVNQLIRSGDIRLELETTTAGKARLEKTIRLIIDEDAVAEKMSEFKFKAPKRADCLEFLAIQKQPIPLRKLNEAGFNGAIAKWLVAHELAAYGQQEIFRDPLAAEDYSESSGGSLTADQQTVLNHAKEAIGQNRFEVMLLHGITGSGKTRVYIEACQFARQQGKQALVLVPEIALTPQMIQRFKAAFADRVSVWHSHLSEGERFDVWQRVRHGAYDVMIGTRSAVFMPLRQLGLIVVDEEHETSFKQDSAPRYHGRDVAIMRARMLNAPCLLGSATPALESYHNARQNRYTLLELPVRVADRPLPAVEIIDMRRQPAISRITPILKQKIEERLERREGIILFLNRRGFSTFVLCMDCGYSFDCVNCHVTLTYHAVTAQIKCHYCNYTRPAPKNCPKCAGFHLSFRGAGTQRVEDEVQQLFPRARVLRLDMDATTTKGAHRRILDEFRLGLADILLGTQMVAKGLDFPHVTLVGVISADVSLNLPDFRAAERTFQLLTQVAGRAGRGDKKGEVIIQTYAPNHYAILTAKTHDYQSFYNREIKERRDLGFPPFCRIMNLQITSSSETRAIEIAEELSQILRGLNHPAIADILGPAPALISKIKGQYRWHLLLKSDNSLELRRLIYAAVLPLNARHQDVNVVINIDPLGMW